MKALFVRQDRGLARATGVLLLLLLVGSCSDPPKNRFQGYVEGEFVYVASPLAGQLETLSVQRGQQVTTGQPLFALDETPEKAFSHRCSCDPGFGSRPFQSRSGSTTTDANRLELRAEKTGGTASRFGLRHTFSSGRMGSGRKAGRCASTAAKHQSTRVRA